MSVTDLELSPLLLHHDWSHYLISVSLYVHVWWKEGCPRHIMDGLDENLCSGNTQYFPISTPASGIRPLPHIRDVNTANICFWRCRPFSELQPVQPDPFDKIYWAAARLEWGEQYVFLLENERLSELMFTDYFPPCSSIKTIRAHAGWASEEIMRISSTNLKLQDGCLLSTQRN